jgi:hypothetical protein
MRNIEEDLEDVAGRLLDSLRQSRGIDTEAADRLRELLRAAAKAWASSPSIPKRSANLFVDLASGIEACRYSYPGEDSQTIGRLADELADLIRACVAIE